MVTEELKTFSPLVVLNVKDIDEEGEEEEVEDGEEFDDDEFIDDGKKATEEDEEVATEEDEEAEADYGSEYGDGSEE